MAQKVGLDDHSSSSDATRPYRRQARAERQDAGASLLTVAAEAASKQASSWRPASRRPHTDAGEPQRERPGDSDRLRSPRSSRNDVVVARTAVVPPARGRRPSSRVERAVLLRRVVRARLVQRDIRRRRRAVRCLWVRVRVRVGMFR